jgi:hypothetical protein
VHDWLVGQGLTFMPAVNWVEWGLYGEGNTRPRYHVLWGIGLALTQRMLARLHEAAQAAPVGRPRLLHRYRVTALEFHGGRLRRRRQRPALARRHLPARLHPDGARRRGVDPGALRARPAAMSPPHGDPPLRSPAPGWPDTPWGNSASPTATSCTRWICTPS